MQELRKPCYVLLIIDYNSNMGKKYFKALKTRAQYSVNKVSKRRKGTWKSKHKYTKLEDWEQSN